MYKNYQLNIRNSKILLLLFIIFSLSACSNLETNLGNKKGNPQNVSSRFAPKLAAAHKAYNEGRLSDAETLFLKYTNEHPNYTEAWFKLGNIYYRTGQYEAAVTAYGNVVQQKPKHSKAWYNLALTRIKQAEVTLERGESQFESTDVNSLKLRNLKNKLRSGIRQKRQVKKK